MGYGLKETTIESIHAVLARHRVIEKAVLYGSRAKGNFKPGSDIDLPLLGDNLTLPNLAASPMNSTICSCLTRLTFPFLARFQMPTCEHTFNVGVVFYERL